MADSPENKDNVQENTTIAVNKTEKKVEPNKYNNPYGNLAKTK